MSVMGGGWAPRGLAVLALILLNACVATGVGVDGAVGVDYDAGYYEPWGYDYGGWGHGYRVGPGRGDDHRRDGDHPHGGPGPRGDHPSRPYRPAPASRPTPSIPSRPRGH